MRFSVFLTFDHQTHVELQTLRENIARLVNGAPSVKGKMGPHLTLAVFDDENQIAVIDSFNKLTAGCRAIKLKIQKLGYFEGRWKILYAAPLATPELHRAHRRVHTAYAGLSSMVPHYRDPADWVPHVTLAKGLKHRVFQEAHAFAEKHWTPLNATVEHIGLINVQRPLEVLVSRNLATA